MKKKLEPIYTLIMPLLLSALLVAVKCYLLRNKGNAAAYIPLFLNLLACCVAFVYAKKMTALTLYRCIAFYFALGCEIPETWVASCLAGTLPPIDFLSSLISEAIVMLRFVLVLAVFWIAAARLGIALGKKNQYLLLAAAIVIAIGLLFPDLLYPACYLFGVCFTLTGAELWTKVIDKTKYGLAWDILLFGVLYCRVVAFLIV